MGFLFFVVLGLASAARTPFGPIPDHCVHRIPAGSHISEVNNRTVVSHPTFDKTWVVPRCSREGGSVGIAPLKRAAARGFPSDYNGWLAYTSYKTKRTTFDTFLGNFTVPNNPSSAPQVLYIFTGLQNVDWVPIVDPEPPVFDIIQPVLQYPADSGSGWSVKSWYVTLDQGALYTDEVPCQAGDVIFGNMTRTASTSWFIGSSVSSSGQTAGLSVSKTRLALQPYAYTTVECYGCTSCASLPTNTLSFSGMSLTRLGAPIEPVWTAFTSPNDICNTVAHIRSPSAVDFTFQ